jgi:hypothetical protein
MYSEITLESACRVNFRLISVRNESHQKWSRSTSLQNWGTGLRPLWIYLYVYLQLLFKTQLCRKLFTTKSFWAEPKIRYIKITRLTMYFVYILIVINTTGWIRIKMSFRQLLWVGNIRVSPPCEIRNRAQVYILKTQMKVKKLVVRFYSGFIWLK